MKEQKVDNSPAQQSELEERARQFGKYLYEAQQREGFGALELQQRIYDSTRSESNVFRGLRTSVWEGYIEKAVEAYTAIMGRA